jgi:hypothetical protein
MTNVRRLHGKNGLSRKGVFATAVQRQRFAAENDGRQEFARRNSPEEIRQKIFARRNSVVSRNYMTRNDFWFE